MRALSSIVMCCAIAAAAVPLQTVTVEVDGETKQEADMPIAMQAGVNYQPILDLTAYQGKDLRVSCHATADSRTQQLIRVSDEIPKHDPNAGGPAFHVHCRFGRLNDPNGLVYYDGQFHLFHQYYYGQIRCQT